MSNWLIAGLTADYILRRIKLTAPLLGSDIVMVLVASTISQANLGHILGDPELARDWGAGQPVPPAGMRRPITAYAVAAALGLPRETVRRKIKTLVAHGYLQEGAQGLIVVPERAAAADVHGLLEAFADLTAGFCAALAEAGVPAAIALRRQPAAASDDRLRIIALASTAFTLRFFEDLRLVVDDIPTGLAYLAIARANLDGLDWRAAPASFDRVPPAEARRPVTAIAVANRLGSSRETTRRQVLKLVDLGYVRLTAAGASVEPGALPQPAAAEFIARTEINVRRLLAALRDTGVARRAAGA